MKVKMNGNVDRVLRGGSSYFDPRNLRCTRRVGLVPVSRNGNVGFRMVIRRKT